MKRDLEHLKLLTVFHFILAGMVAVVGSFFIFYVVMGIMMINGTFPGPRPGAAGGPPPFLGWFMLGMGAFMILLCWTQAICLAIAGYCLSRRKKWLFCCVVAGISCLNAPLGTALGVCTLLVLLRPTVKDLFAGRIIEPRSGGLGRRRAGTPPTATVRENGRSRRRFRRAASAAGGSSPAA